MLITMDCEPGAFLRHTLPLPSCCPVSGNPQEGSEIRISYRSTGAVLEVYALADYLRSFIGGHSSGVRTMEGMAQQVAEDCARTVEARVTVRAIVLLQEGTLELVTRSKV